MLKWVGISAIAWVTVSQPAFSQLILSQAAPQAVQSECTLFPEPLQLNTQQFEDEGEESVIVIGYQPNRRYQLILVDRSEETFNRLRTCVLDAYLTRLRTGSYVQVGSFRRRREAEAIRRILRRNGYRVRVIYRR
ncbi:MAG: SPOR domain-containing protein [Cyanobacteria bacterium P01_D01_bin.1]